VSAPVAADEPEPALVWKEPAITLSHDTEMFLKGVKNLNAAPSLAPSTTETRTTDPVMDASPATAAEIELKPAAEPEASPIREEVPEAATFIPAGPIADLETETVEATTLESIAKSRPLSDEGPVVHTQPSRSSEPAVPSSNGGSKENKTMNKESNPQFDTLVLDVAHIIFGDNAPEINVRLVRMALEQVWQNRANLQSLDAIAKEIARIIFGEGNTSDLNVRLVKMALERSNSIALFKAA
jgi:hypothetical protein